VQQKFDRTSEMFSDFVDEAFENFASFVDRLMDS